MSTWDEKMNDAEQAAEQGEPEADRALRLALQVEAETERLLVKRWAEDKFAEEVGALEESGWKPKRLTQARKATPPSVGYLGNGQHMLTSGRVHLAYGAGSGGKTWLGWLIAVQEIRKGNAVLLVDFEMGDSLTLDRLHTLGLTDEEIDAGVVYVDPNMSPSAADRAWLVEAVRESVGDKVLTYCLVDSLTESAALDTLAENDTGDMTRWFRANTRWIVEQWPTCALLVIDHLPKDNPDAKMPIGSQRKQSASHALFAVRNNVEFSRDKDGHSTVFVTRSRDGWLTPGALARLEIGPGVEGYVRLMPPKEEDQQAARVEVLRARITLYLSQHGPSKTDDIKKGVQGTAADIVKELAEMAAEKDPMITLQRVGNAKIYALTED